MESRLIRTENWLDQALPEVDGRVLSRAVSFKAAARYADYTTEVAGQRLRATFDPAGGQLRELEWVMRLADGSLRQYGMWEIVVEAEVTPPDEVLTAVEAVK